MIDVSIRDDGWEIKGIYTHDNPYTYMYRGTFEVVGP
jgi:hypothetical protein